MENQFEFVIKADTNDADYVTETHTVTQQKIDDFMPIIEAIKNCTANYNWSVGDYTRADEGPEVVYKDILTEDQIDLMNDYVPYGENGIHTIVSIVYYPVPEKVRLL